MVILENIWIDVEIGRIMVTHCDFGKSHYLYPQEKLCCLCDAIKLTAPTKSRYSFNIISGFEFEK